MSFKYPWLGVPAASIMLGGCSLSKGDETSAVPQGLSQSTSRANAISNSRKRYRSAKIGRTLILSERPFVLDHVKLFDNKRVHLSNVTSNDAGGQVTQAYTLPENEGYDLYISPTVDGSVQLNAPDSTPSDSSASTPSAATTAPFSANYLDFPTYHAANSCFEVGILYQRTAGSPTTDAPELYVYDACLPGSDLQSQPATYFFTPITPSFIATYNTSDSSTQPDFYVEEFRQHSANYDLVTIYNNQTGFEDVLRSSTNDPYQTPPSSTFATRSWFLFETHYAPGPCSNFGNLTAATPYYWPFDETQPSMEIPSSDITAGSFGNCMTDDKSPDTYWYKTYENDEGQMQVGAVPN